MRLYKKELPVFEFWGLVWRSLQLFNRRHELQRLVAWADGKRLEGPLRLYRQQLVAEDHMMVRLSMRSQLALCYAWRIHRLAYFLFPPPRARRSGAARGYRRLVDPKSRFAYSMKV